MTGVDDDGSRWIGGLLVDATVQRTGVGRAAVTVVRDRLAAEPGCPEVALSYPPGEAEDDGAEVVARWTPSA